MNLHNKGLIPSGVSYFVMNFSGRFSIFKIRENKESYFPRPAKKTFTFSLLPRCVRLTCTESTMLLLRIACSKPCGAISIVKAFWGSKLTVSSNRTGLKRLFVWYSAEQTWFSGRSQRVFGTLELNHLADLCFGSMITCLRRDRSFGPIPAMYLE